MNIMKKNIMKKTCFCFLSETVQKLLLSILWKYAKQRTYDIYVEVMYQLLTKERFGTIAEEDKAKVSCYQFKKAVNITDDKDTVFTSQFLKIYLHHGPYIKRLQHLMPSEYSNKVQTQKLKVIHNFYQCLLENS